MNTMESDSLQRQQELVQKYGKERVKLVYLFYTRIVRNFGFRSDEEIGFDWVTVLQNYSQVDFDYCFSALAKNCPDFLKTTDIRRLCHESYLKRLKQQKAEELLQKKKEQETNYIPMPKYIRAQFDSLLKHSMEGDPTKERFQNAK